MLNKKVIEILENKINKKSKELKIFATKSISNKDTKECLRQIEYRYSWDSVSESPIYLCSKNMNGIETNIQKN